MKIFDGNPLKGLSKPQLYITIAGAVVIGGYLEVHHHSTTGSWNPWSSTGAGTNSANDPTAIDPVTGMAYSQDNVTDPITGETYLAEAEEFGSVAAAESAVSAFGGGSGTGTGVPQPPASGQPGNGGTGSGGAYTSNAAWAQAATAGLADVGFNEQDVARALGDYLESVPVTPQQAQLINTALSEYGNPPIGTFQIILKPTTGAGTKMATVPDVVSLDLESAQRDITAAQLKSTASGPAFKEGFGTRVVTKQEPAARAHVTPGTNVKLTYKIEHAPKPVLPGKQ